MRTKIYSITLIYLALHNLLSFTGWELLQNSPTTNELHSVYFIDDNTGWISGYNSTIYKTTNSGQTWQQQTSPESCNFQCITFWDASTGWACGSSGVVIKTTNGGTNWFSQTFTASRFNSMDFISADTGYICGDNGNIRKTTNGGNNWIAQTSGTTHNLHQINMTSNTGLAVGDNAYILRTFNGGNSWEIVSGPGLASQIFYAFSIGSDEQFFVNLILAAGTLVKYSDSYGNFWYLGDFPAEPVYSLVNTGINKFFAVGANGYIASTFLSTNYGMNWTQEASPSSQNLYSVCFSNNSNIIWAVGSYGTILKNEPSWKKILNAHGEGLDFINQNTGWLVYGNSIQKTTNSGTNWATQNFGSANLFSVYFQNVNTGYAVGFNGVILKTTNSGTNWLAQISGTSQDFYSVFFPETNTGYVCGETGTLIKTTNGGTNWVTQTSGTSQFLYSVFFPETNTGYACGDNGTLIKTTNSGTNWIAQISGTSQDFYSVFFPEANTGYVCGSNGTILKTTNSGTNWIRQTSGIIGSIGSVYFIDSYRGYATTDLNIFRTDDGGNSWYSDEMPERGLIYFFHALEIIVENNTAVGFAVGEICMRTSFEYLGGEPVGNSGNYPGWVGLSSGTNQSLVGVEYVNPFIAFAVGMRDPPGSGQGTILRTINGGQSWVRQQSNVNAEFGAVSFADVNNGIAVGYPAFMVHTTNSGLNWVQQTSPIGSTLIDVDMLDVNNAYICGDAGKILHTTNGGNNWVIETSGTSSTLLDIDYINQTTAATVGLIGLILRTTNGGISWFTQNSGISADVISIDFTDVNNGIAVTLQGPSLRTTNGGATWIPSDSLGYVRKVCYINPNNAFASGDGGLIYRTTNGGINWILQNANTAENLFSVNFADVNNGIIVGENGNIIRTSNAGVISGTNTTYNRNNLGLPIIDLGNTNDSINVNVTDNSVNIVTRVYLKLDTVLHTNDGDLEFYLEHNDITDTLVYRAGGSGDNFLGTFLNDATNFPLVSGSSPFRGSYKPSRPLSKFNGQSPNGFWKLRIYDAASGNTGILDAWSLIITYTSVIGITGNQNIPSEFKLYQNYPNPFNPVTKIKFTIPAGKGKDLSAKLRIYDILGREVTTLINQQMKPGSYLVEWNAGNFASGVYFYRLETESHTETKKMVLIK